MVIRPVVRRATPLRPEAVRRTARRADPISREAQRREPLESDHLGSRNLHPARKLKRSMKRGLRCVSLAGVVGLSLAVSIRAQSKGKYWNAQIRTSPVPGVRFTSGLMVCDE